MEVNYFLAFTSGLISFFAPCVLPLLPAYIGYITGLSVSQLKNQKNNFQYQKQVFISSLLYVAGFSLIFVLMGTAAAGIGRTFTSNLNLIQTIGGLIIIIFALHFLGMFRISILESEFKFKLPGYIEKFGYFRPFVIGMIFATAWSPCVGAVLGVILTLAATTQTLISGASLLFVYSLGISIPFIIIASSIAQAPIYLKKIQPYLNAIEKVSGLILLIIGFLLFNNHLKLISPNLTYNRLNGVINSWDTRIKTRFINLDLDKNEKSLDELIRESKIKYPNSIDSQAVLGQPIGRLEFKDFDNQTFLYSSDLNQAPHVFYFWASWLPIAYIDLPILEELSQKYPQIKIIGIHRSDTEDPQLAKDVLADLNINLRQLYGNGDFYNQVSGIGMPVYVFVDKNGTIVDINQGSIEPRILEEKLQLLVK